MTAMKDLLAAARADAPSDLVRDRVWGHVAARTIAPPPAPSNPGAAKLLAAKLIGKSGSLKLVALGALLGGAVVFALALPYAATARAPQAPGTVVVGAAAGLESAAATVAATRIEALPAADPTIELDPVPAAPAPGLAPSPLAPSSPLASSSSSWKASAPSRPQEPHPSGLAEEARLVTEARSALVRGDAARALSLVRSTRELPVRMLEPEELVVEARSLRALGRPDEALAAELTLKRRFPEHALSR